MHERLLIIFTRQHVEVPVICRPRLCLRFLVLMTETWRVKRCIIIVIMPKLITILFSTFPLLSLQHFCQKLSKSVHVHHSQTRCVCNIQHVIYGFICRFCLVIPQCLSFDYLAFIFLCKRHSYIVLFNSIRACVMLC